jgi:hypothetical protein
LPHGASLHSQNPFPAPSQAILAIQPEMRNSGCHISPVVRRPKAQLRVMLSNTPQKKTIRFQETEKTAENISGRPKPTKNGPFRKRQHPNAARPRPSDSHI